MAPWHGLSHKDGTCQGVAGATPHACSMRAPAQLAGQQDGSDRQPWQGHEARGAAASTKPPRSRLLALGVCVPVGNRAGETGSAAYTDSCPLLQAEGPSPLQMFHTKCCKPQGPAELSSAQAALSTMATQGGQAGWASKVQSEAGDEEGHHIISLPWLQFRMRGLVQVRKYLPWVPLHALGTGSSLGHPLCAHGLLQGEGTAPRSFSFRAGMGLRHVPHVMAVPSHGSLGISRERSHRARGDRGAGSLQRH